MSKTYAVWVHVEEHDTHTDRYTDVDLPEKLATFGNYEEASEYAGKTVDLAIEQFNNDMVFLDTTIGRVGQ